MSSASSEYAWYKLFFSLLLIFSILGINRTALREIKLLQELHHPNIIGVIVLFNSYYIVHSEVYASGFTIMYGYFL